MGRIPNYLRTTTNRYKGLITEKVALNYLRKRGFLCEEFEHVALMVEHIEKYNWEEEKERYKRDLKNTPQNHHRKALRLGVVRLN